MDFFKKPLALIPRHGSWPFTCICAAILFGAMTCLGKAGPDGVIITLSFLSAGFGGQAYPEAVGEAPQRRKRPWASAHNAWGGSMKHLAIRLYNLLRFSRWSDLPPFVGKPVVSWIQRDVALPTMPCHTP